MRQKTSKTIENIDVVCDVCGNAVTNTFACPARQCCMCRHDICHECTVFDDRETGDYPARYCENCWYVGGPFREQQRAAEKQCDKAIDEADMEWAEACLIDWTRWDDLLDWKAKRSLTEPEQTEYDKISKVVAKIDAYEESNR